MKLLGYQLLLVFADVIPDLTGETKRRMTPTSSTNTRYFEFLEKNSHLLYPALAVVVIVLIVMGILQAWREKDMDGVQKAELKREVVIQLRKNLGGTDAESLSRAVGLSSFKLVKLLEEMQTDGVVISYVNTQRLTIWRLKGVGPASR